MNSHNRNMTRGALHDVCAPNFKRLNSWSKAGVRVDISRRIGAENDATRETPDSWAAVEAEKLRVKRKAMIHQAFMRTKI